MPAFKEWLQRLHVELLKEMAQGRALTFTREGSGPLLYSSVWIPLEAAECWLKH